MNLSFTAHRTGYANQLLYIESIVGMSYLLDADCAIYNDHSSHQYSYTNSLSKYLIIPWNVKFHLKEIPKIDSLINLHMSVYYTDDDYKDPYIEPDFLYGRKIITKNTFKKSKYNSIIGFGLYSSFYYGDRASEVKDFLKTISFTDEVMEAKDKILDYLLDNYRWFNALHIRRGNFNQWIGSKKYISNITESSIINDIVKNFNNDYPIVVFTDDNDFFDSLKQQFKKNELINFNTIANEYSNDIVSLTSMLIGGESYRFLGTVQSTFTGMIHRYRELKGLDHNFKYISNGINVSSNMLPSGFPYSWNHTYYKRIGEMAFWMREWKECL